MIGVWSGVVWTSSPGYTRAFFLAFVFYSVFAFMNVIIALLVEAMIDAGRNDRTLLVRGEGKAKHEFLRNMRQVFDAVDVDKSGAITREEMRVQMQDGEVADYFAALGIDANQVGQLFRLLDKDNSGTITRAEFLKGCLDLRGNAKSIDMAVVNQELKLLQEALEEVLDNLDPLEGMASKLAIKATLSRRSGRSADLQQSSQHSMVPQQQEKTQQQHASYSSLPLVQRMPQLQPQVETDERRHRELSLLREGANCEFRQDPQGEVVSDGFDSDTIPTAEDIESIVASAVAPRSHQMSQSKEKPRPKKSDRLSVYTQDEEV